MFRRAIALVVVLGIAAPGVSAAPLDPEQKLELARLDLGLIALLLAGFEGILPEEMTEAPSRKLEKVFDGLRPVSDAVKPLGPVRSTRLPLRDPWGRTYAFAFVEEHLLVMSPGPDGSADFDYGADDAAVLATIGRITEGSLAIRDDVVWIDGQSLGADPDRAPRKAMADLRSLGTAIESFAVDSNRYPSTEGRLVPIDAVSGSIEPIYIRLAPRIDPWGFPYLYASDGKHYLVVTHGSDGVLERNYAIDAVFLPEGGLRGGGPVAHSHQDLVFSDGSFWQYFEPSQVSDEADEPGEP